MNTGFLSEIILFKGLYFKNTFLYSNSTNSNVVIVVFIGKNRDIFINLSTTTKIESTSSSTVLVCELRRTGGSLVIKFIKIFYYGRSSIGNGFKFLYGLYLLGFET